MKKTLVTLGVVAAAGVTAPIVLAQAPSTQNRVVGTANATSKAQIKKNVVVYRTTGTVTFPEGSVIGLPGVTVAPYTRPVVCDGQVRVTVYRGGKRLNRKTVSLSSACTFSTSNTVSRKRAYGRTLVRVAYLGGTDIIADTAPSQSFQVPRKRR